MEWPNVTLCYLVCTVLYCTYCTVLYCTVLYSAFRPAMTDVMSWCLQTWCDDPSWYLVSANTGQWWGMCMCSQPDIQASNITVCYDLMWGYWWLGQSSSAYRKCVSDHSPCSCWREFKELAPQWAVSCLHCLTFHPTAQFPVIRLYPGILGPQPYTRRGSVQG